MDKMKNHDVFGVCATSGKFMGLLLVWKVSSHAILILNTEWRYSLKFGCQLLMKP